MNSSTNVVLSSLGFSRADIDQISSIIDGHDTRPEALSLNDQLVKDADRLWRFTPTGIAVDLRRFGSDRDEHLAFLERNINNWFFTPEAKEMARERLLEIKKAAA